MKIVVLGKNNHLCWDNNVVDAFSNLGHEVFHLQINKRPMFIQCARGLLKGILGKENGANLGDKFYSDTLRKELENIKPNIIFTTSASFIPKVFYEMIRSISSKPKIFAWEGDGGLELDKNSYLSELVDVMFDMADDSVQKNIFSFQNIFHLGAATNENIFKDLELKRKNKVYFCGNMSPDRNLFFSKLKDYNLILKGLQWEKLNANKNNFEIKNGLIKRKELVIDYNSYFAAINYHQKEVADYSRGMNMRGFEILSTKTLLVTDHREFLNELFDIEKEICVYRSIDELKEILTRVEKNPKEFEQIRQNGYKRVLSEHTYTHRMKKVLEIYNQL